jgi:hypothetical protein
MFMHSHFIENLTIDLETVNPLFFIWFYHKDDHDDKNNDSDKYNIIGHRYKE